jgi:Co/Zn/Cd efflux system component
MAEHALAHTGSTAAMDYAEHERTYRGFVRFVKIATIAIALLLICLAIFLV